MLSITKQAILRAALLRYRSRFGQIARFSCERHTIDRYLAQPPTNRTEYAKAAGCVAYFAAAWAEYNDATCKAISRIPGTINYGQDYT